MAGRYLFHESLTQDTSAPLKRPILELSYGTEPKPHEIWNSDDYPVVWSWATSENPVL